MFNSTIAKTAFLDAFNKIEFGHLGLRPGPATLELRADAIKQAGKLFAELIEQLAADADASISTGKVDETIAYQIEDATADIAGEIRAAACALLEAAE